MFQLRVEKDYSKSRREDVDVICELVFAHFKNAVDCLKTRYITSGVPEEVKPDVRYRIGVFNFLIKTLRFEDE